MVRIQDASQLPEPELELELEPEPEPEPELESSQRLVRDREKNWAHWEEFRDPDDP
jgi:hypothetical protein